MFKKLIVGHLLLLCLNFSVNARSCELYLSTCPENFRNLRIEVPTDVSALHNKIYACDASSIIEGMIDSDSPPSIMFVIDHSYSMMGLGNTYPGNDPYGARFRVTLDLIDSVYARYPKAEVGVVVFREVLYFDHRNNSYFKQLTNQGDQSYLPLFQLDKKVQGVTNGIDIVKQVLKTDTSIQYSQKYGINVECADLVYKPQFTTIGNTNINNAFDAAIEAMALSSYPKSRQFIIFLSDGEPHPVNDPSQHGGKDPFYFQQGLNTPATFTVYLHNTETVPPQSLVTMTSNIKVNNYSTANTKSDIWILKSNYEALKALFIDRIFNTILNVTTGNAVTMSVNGIMSNNRTDSGFVFNKSFEFNTDSTVFNIATKYHLINTVSGAERDTQTVSSLTFVRKANASVPDGMSMLCQSDKQMGFYYNGVKITSATDQMTSIELRLEGLSSVNSALVSVLNVNAASIDNVQLSVVKIGAYYTGTFNRVIANALKDDKTLQHQKVDSITAVYRNPDDLSDSVRIAIPFVPDVVPPVSYTVTSAAINSPYKDGMTVPLIVKSDYAAAGRLDVFKDKGMVLTILPISQSGAVPALKGEVTIFDVVKNVLVDKAPMVLANNRLYFIWDCTNKNGRKVATGTYSVIFVITDTNGKKETRTMRIGIQR
ncbi:MAG: hypothetical protein ACM31E_03990 [Fibrobacterota bacterium]